MSKSVDHVIKIGENVKNQPKKFGVGVKKWSKKLNLPDPHPKITFWHITVFFWSRKSKNLEKSASGGQCLTDRQFQRYVSCRLNTCEHFHTNFFLTPRGLIG